MAHVKQKRSVVPVGQEMNFEMHCLDLLEQPTEGGSTHKQKIKELKFLFPKTKQWIQWWTMPDVGVSLFLHCLPVTDDRDLGCNRCLEDGG
ncbi:hypothetical protein PSTG_03015 [Puccinia striiformis f. sp. tritici PST-78]|uniref:Uncharacterized protein n=1 Tax=Puccinia striiformis f. sp. tritici PST-78 TaxID=1165861 RepID=A0A0L0VXD6_9BASI|nr:hypothetical protein PSTG_03015 [Puccinia striiformis f. sp. tritici PST-78]